MKRLVTLALLALSSIAFGATLNPVQLLNPAGSTAGQAIVSTGTSSAPAWGNVPVANVTGLGTAATVNTGTSGATIPLLNGANTWSAAQAFTAAITPSQTAGIVGTTTNNNANAGSVGEDQTASTALTSMTAGALTNYASKSLTAGDWRCQGTVDYVPDGTTPISRMLQGISTTSATAAPFGAGTYYEYAVPAGSEQVMVTPVVRVQLSTTTTVFLTGFVQFAVSTLQARGSLDCWRPR